MANISAALAQTNEDNFIRKQRTQRKVPGTLAAWIGARNCKKRTPISRFRYPGHLSVRKTGYRAVRSLKLWADALPGGWRAYCMCWRRRPAAVKSARLSIRMTGSIRLRRSGGGTVARTAGLGALAAEMPNMQCGQRILLLHAGGFGVVALDFCETNPKSLNRIPLSYWFRFRRAIESTPTILLIAAEANQAKSCSFNILNLELKAARWRGSPGFRLLGGTEIAGEVGETGDWGSAAPGIGGVTARHVCLFICACGCGRRIARAGTARSGAGVLTSSGANGVRYGRVFDCAA